MNRVEFIPNAYARIVLIVAFLSVSGVSAIACPWTEPGLLSWSNNSTWPGSVVPGSGTNVTILAGTRVLYDVTTPGITYGGIVISPGAQLIFDGTKNVFLQTNYIWIQYGGALIIGNSTCRYPTKALITLFGPYDKVTSYGNLGNKNIAINGDIQMFGNPPSPTWTNVAATVNVNATVITVKDTVSNWNVGDSIVIASTDYYQDLTETFTIVAISGKLITLDRPAKYLHWGQDNEFAEVGHITRNIRIQGDSSSHASQFGGHCIVAGNGSAHVYGVEFTNMGQKGLIGRYPFHFHVMGDLIGKGYFVNECSFHNNYQRCLTVHGTSGILVQNNVGFNVTGHCYFLEEGSETFNVYNHNLGMNVYPGPLISTDSTPSIFWITNPNNTWTNNVAVGGVFGFWFSLPLHPLGLTAYQTWVYPRFTPLIQFDNNLAHSSSRNGIHADDCPNADGTTALCSYSPLVPPYTATTAGYNTPSVPATFNKNNAYKNRQYGIWFKGSTFTFQNSLLIDNGIGINIPAGGNIIKDSIIIAETANIGTPGFTQYFNDLGRSRPQLWNTGFPVHGFEGYDNGGSQFARNVTFVNFTTDSVRRAGALGSLPNGKFILPPTNMFAQITLQNSNAFAMVENTVKADGPAHVVFIDTDGSVTGAVGNTITSNSSILRSVPGCSVVPAWNYFLNCSQNSDGYSNIVVLNQNTAASDFGSSLNWTYRAAWIPFGNSAALDNITAGDTANVIRTTYATNALSRKGYVLKFYHPTPPSLQVNLRYASTGEWVVVALQYPATTFVVTRGYSNIPVTQVASLSLLTSTTYYYDSANQYLYVMYFEDNGSLISPAGFPQYGYGASYINILAGCGNTCSVTGTPAIPSTWADSEDKYQATLKGCSSGTASGKSGTAYFKYNKNTHYVTYIIYHNIVTATSGAIYSNGRLIQNLPVGQAPIRGGFSISWLKHNALWNGNWTVAIKSVQFPSTSEISGPIGCLGSCSTPPSVSAADPCAPINQQLSIYNDNALNTTSPVGWYDWSYNTVKNYTYSDDRACGNTSINVLYSSYGTVSLHAGTGNCNPGNCTQSWQRPFVNVSSYAFFQFNVRSPAGPTPTPISIQCTNSTGQNIAPAFAVPFNYIDNFVVEETWTRVKVPLSVLGFKGTELVGNFGIGLYANLPSNWTLLIDDIRLVPNYADTTTKAPTGSVKLYSIAC